MCCTIAPITEAVSRLNAVSVGLMSTPISGILAPAIAPVCTVRPRISHSLESVPTSTRGVSQVWLKTGRTTPGRMPWHVNATAVVDIAIEDRGALGGQAVVELPWPSWRADLPDRVLELGEAAEVGRVVRQIVAVELEDPALLDRMEDCENAVDLAEVAGKPEDIVAVVGEPRPLCYILDRRVPQERIAGRGVGARDVVRDQVGGRLAEVEAGEPVEDHRDRIEARRPPARTGQRPLASACRSADARFRGRP